MYRSFVSPCSSIFFFPVSMSRARFRFFFHFLFCLSCFPPNPLRLFSRSFAFLYLSSPSRCAFLARRLLARLYVYMSRSCLIRLFLDVCFFFFHTRVCMLLHKHILLFFLLFSARLVLARCLRFAMLLHTYFLSTLVYIPAFTHTHAASPPSPLARLVPLGLFFSLGTRTLTRSSLSLALSLFYTVYLFLARASAKELL